MDGAPSNCNQLGNEKASMASTTSKFTQLNVNAAEFRPSCGPVAASISTPPSTSGVVQQSADVEKKPIEKMTTTTIEFNDQLEMDEPFQAEDEDDTPRMAEASSSKTSVGDGASATTVTKEKKNVVVKRDIVRKKEPVNILFCGHVDAGKSTIGGQLLYLTGQLDKRTLEEYQKEARKKSRESWSFAYALDTNEEEREKGKTVEVGRAWFETEKKHFIILDAPGHRCFVPNMIVGASQADIAILVISARKGEFEKGFERGGQTREHAMLVKTAGVRYLIVLINKMDDPTVGWDEARYREIKEKVTPYLKKCGFKPDEDTIFMPCSGMSGAILKEHPGSQILPWYTGPTFIEYLDGLPSFNRSIDGPFRMPIVERYKEMGVIVMGKIESGHVRVGDRCLVMPNRTRVEVTNIYYEEIETDSCVCGENVRLKLKNVEEEEILPGFILCDIVHKSCGVGRVFDARISIIEHESIIGPGYSAVLQIHTAVAEVQLKALIALINPKTRKAMQPPPRFIAQDQMAIARFELSQAGAAICMESFEDFPQLGRFILRDKDRTVAVGKVLKIIE